MKTLFAAGPSITDLEIEVVNQALRSGWYEDAYYFVEKLQREFAAFHDRKFALMTPNCTSALHLVLAALGIKEGDEVIVPECTWIATSAPINYLGATPVFCDIDAHHWCLDEGSVARAITDKTKAIITVDLYGSMARMERLQKLADSRGIALIEDAAAAIGSTYQGIRAGKFGKASVFSFHRTKTISAGEGGMLCLDDQALYERCAFLRDHGRDPKKLFYNTEVGFKHTPSNLLASLAYAQFQRLDELLSIKKRQFEFYREHLRGIDDIYWNAEIPGGVNSYWMTTLVLGRSHHLNKEDLLGTLLKKGIPARPFFYPLSSLPAYNEREKYEPLCPVSYAISDRAINLPGAAILTEDDMLQVCTAIKEALRA